MNTKNVDVYGSSLPFRCSQKKLERLLAELPLQINGLGLHLEARVGLGNIVYMRATSGYIHRIAIKGKGVTIESDRNLSDNLIFRYKGILFGLEYARIQLDEYQSRPIKQRS